MTAAEKLTEQGRVEGRVEGMVLTLERQLRLRFGPLPGALAQRLEGASVEQLERWTDAVLTATSLEELFGPE